MLCNVAHWYSDYCVYQRWLIDRYPLETELDTVEAWHVRCALARWIDETAARLASCARLKGRKRINGWRG